MVKCQNANRQGAPASALLAFPSPSPLPASHLSSLQCPRPSGLGYAHGKPAGPLEDGLWQRQAEMPEPTSEVDSSGVPGTQAVWSGEGCVGS